MTHFRTKNDLLEWLEQHAPYRQIRRAVVEGEVELCGHFKGSVFMPEGWVVKIRSRFGKEWVVGIHLDLFYHKYRARILHDILWCYWQGGNSELFNGDDPEKYKRLKGEWE